MQKAPLHLQNGDIHFPVCIPFTALCMICAVFIDEGHNSATTARVQIARTIYHFPPKKQGPSTQSRPEAPDDAGDVALPHVSSPQITPLTPLDNTDTPYLFVSMAPNTLQIKNEIVLASDHTSEATD